MKGIRGERLASQFREEIYKIINGALRNRYPELSAIISITYADVAPDLKSAKIYISIYDIDEQKKLKSFEIIKSNSGFIRHGLSRILRIRTVPELHFILDGTMEYGARIDKLLESVAEERHGEEDD